MSLIQDIQDRFSRLWISEKLIIINVLIFILDRLLVFLFRLHPEYFIRWFELPENFMSFITQPWSIVTYAFFHDPQNFFHLFWNMILLYFAGRLFLTLFGPKRFITVYILGAIAGGILFLLSYNLFPVFSDIHSALVGASAAIMSVLIFICTYTPDREVRLIFIPLRLWHIGVIFVLLDLVQLPLGNPGGHLAHLGGALFGFFYARNLRKDKDIGRWFERLIFNIIGTSYTKKTRPLKTVYKNKTATRRSDKSKTDKDRYQRQIDEILDKISKSGYESLSKEEKDFLFKAGKE